MRIFLVQLEQIMSFMQNLVCEGSSKVLIFWGMLGYCFYHNLKLLIYHKRKNNSKPNGNSCKLHCSHRDSPIISWLLTNLYKTFVYFQILKVYYNNFSFFSLILCRENLVGFVVFFLPISLLNTSICIDSSIQNYSYQLNRGSKTSNPYAEVWNTINLILMIK